MGRSFRIEAIILAVAILAVAIFWGWQEALSVLIGAGAYLLPYGLAYALFFGLVPGSRPLVNDALASKRKAYFAGGFLAAEFVKLLLTLAILGAAFLWYRQANWPVLLSAFASAIVINFIALWWALKPKAN